MTFQTAVAQAELEARDYPGAYHRVAFERTDGNGPVHIETTRPELIAACVALVAHPDDEADVDQGVATAADGARGHQAPRRGDAPVEGQRDREHKPAEQHDGP